MSLVPLVNLQKIDKWDIDFFGPITPPGKIIGAHYIIVVTYYLTRCVETTLIRDCTTGIAAIFLFDDVVTQFGCPNILISDQGTHFLNQLIDKLTNELQIHH